MNDSVPDLVEVVSGVDAVASERGQPEHADKQQFHSEHVSGEVSDIIKLSEAAERGDCEAQIRMGMRFRNGDGVAKDHQQALRWFRMSADQGCAEGLDNVGLMHLSGWGVPVDFGIAAAYFKASAAQDHAQALFNLGNCHFSGQGVEQDYAMAIECWQRAADMGHQNSIWRLATLDAAGEGLPCDRGQAERRCQQIAANGHANAALLLGEILTAEGRLDEARRWWNSAAEHGSIQAKALLEVDAWRRLTPVSGEFAFIEVDHLYQGWNNCGATSIAMFARHFGVDTTPYAVKRLCPQSPIGTGTDWEDLVAAGGKLEQAWKMIAFPNDDAGFVEGTKVIRRHLDAGRPVVIDFTVIRNTDGKEERFGHTLLVVGYHTGRGRFVVKNPNQPSPGIELMTKEELESSWVSSGYSRLAEGRAARPLIVMDAT